MKKAILYLDETGFHNLKKVDSNFPIFLLCGIVIDENEALVLENKINDLKLEIFNKTEIVLHSREIRKWENDFKVLHDINLRDKFYKELSKVVKDVNFQIISSAVKINEYIKEFGPTAENPYMVSLSFILERFMFFLDKESFDNGSVIAESRGRKEDAQLHTEYLKITSNGTFYIPAERFSSKLIDFDFKSKKENIAGLQLSDLIAYPIANKIIFPDRDNLSFKECESKFYKQFDDDDYLGYGLKVYP